jgi:hypothetical protein
VALLRADVWHEARLTAPLALRYVTLAEPQNRAALQGTVVPCSRSTTHQQQLQQQ